MSRRNLAKGAAWTVPVLAAGVPALPASASTLRGDITVTVSSCVSGSGLPLGNRNGRVTFAVCAKDGTIRAGTTFVLEVTGLTLGSGAISGTLLTASNYANGTFTLKGDLAPTDNCLILNVRANALIASSIQLGVGTLSPGTSDVDTTNSSMTQSFFGVAGVYTACGTSSRP